MNVFRGNALHMKIEAIKDIMLLAIL
jgi:hypothetical protein